MCVQCLEGLTRQRHVPTDSVDPRAKTAPEKNRRKNWVVGSVNLKTQEGDKLRVKAPGQLRLGYRL